MSLYCLECKIAGGAYQELHIIFNVVSDSKEDDEHKDEHENEHKDKHKDDNDRLLRHGDDDENDDDDDDGDLRQKIQDHIKRA